jgi:cytochrome c
MKYFFPLAFLLFACGGETEKKETPADKPADISQNPDYQKGLDVLAKSNCATCHKVDGVIQGPSYRDVANKYAGSDTAIAYLSKKIIEGGSGVWGNIAMVAHPEISQADAEQVVKYILLLKNN